MNDAGTPLDRERIIEIATADDDESRRELARQIASAWEQYREVVAKAMSDPAVRRWAREQLADQSSGVAAAELASLVLEWADDFSPSKRDRTTGQFVAGMPRDLLMAHLYQLVGSNAASTLWERIASDGENAVMAAARDVLSNAGSDARETTLHLLVLDPYGESPLGRQAQDELLNLVLDDPDPEIRGLAAEVIAADMPEILLDRWESAPVDGSERVRMAFWEAALVHRSDAAFDHAAAIVLDPYQDHASRRTALIATGERVSTRQLAPLLQTLLRGDDEVLAEDAAQLMWRHHRAPDVATAASESKFERVRDLAERLLHPERGSPAAGGSRPGDPTRTGEIFDQLSRSEDRRGPEPEE